MNVYTEDYSARINPSVQRANDAAEVHSQASTMVNPSSLRSINDPVPGWPKLAKAISETPDLELLPSFADLNIKSLLYYQAELVTIRQALHEEECKDVVNPSSRFSPYYSKDLRVFINARNQSIKDKTPLPHQWELIEQLRTTLERYSKLLTNTCRRRS